ncbi:MAG TPA: phosphoribosylamine--glycine ligase [Gaiellaceae bacterium]|nr:phosphoribosylamine--glycine ligase [Gaiellaceae bacterium]
MRVLVVGSGGREHALAWKLAQSSELAELHAAPGNPGIATLGNCHPVRADDADGLLALARELEIGLVVVGPEAPLVAGLADRLRLGGVTVFGPSQAAARIEGSKAFAKEVMESAGVATARTLPVARAPCVVKVDGLAAGKGVFVCRDDDELQAALAETREHGERFLIEELLEGDELSVFALCDGRRAVPLAAARDYKRARDGDDGPNTGGMGAYSPVDGVGALDTLVDETHGPVLAELAARGAPFSGLLYAGLMLTGDGPRVLEFNCRFGDPETQAVLPRISSDLLPALAGAAAGDLGSTAMELSDDAAVTVVVAAQGYPHSGDTGSPIDGVADAEALGALVFHAGTAERDHALVTSGGRILGVTGVGPDLAAARDRAYSAVERISFQGSRYRRDIGA